MALPPLQTHLLQPATFGSHARPQQHSEHAQQYHQHHHLQHTEHSRSQQGSGDSYMQDGDVDADLSPEDEEDDEEDTSPEEYEDASATMISPISPDSPRHGHHAFQLPVVSSNHSYGHYHPRDPSSSSSTQVQPTRLAAPLATFANAGPAGVNGGFGYYASQYPTPPEHALQLKPVWTNQQGPGARSSWGWNGGQ